LEDGDVEAFALIFDLLKGTQLRAFSFAVGATLVATVSFSTIPTLLVLTDTITDKKNPLTQPTRKASS
jgi:hypothetical protein